MAEKLSDEFVEELLNLMRSDASVDAKVDDVTYAKSSIKQFNVPEPSAPLLFEALRLASVSPHSALANAGFTSLNHLFTRLSRQEPRILSKEASKSLPVVIEKLGDPKEKFRTVANQSLITLYGVAPMDVERFVRNTAMVGKNVRAKEAAMTWIVQMHHDHAMAFRGYVPSLMDLLEDADPSVRETAKVSVIELFKNASNMAKSDLKRQLKNFKVRPAIEQAIVKALAPVSGSSVRSDTPSDSFSTLAPTASVSSVASDRPNTPANIETNADSLDPMYVNTSRELDDIFREMTGFFEGRESEQNWLKREESMTKLRRLMVGNVPNDFADQFVVGLKALLDGIVKAITSLRTSLSKEGCALVQDAAKVFGPGIDPLVEILLQTLIKLCAATKKIASQQANATVEAIISRVTYNNRLMQHIWGAAQDKNVQPRLYSTSWLKIILTKESHHKSHIEHSGGLDIIEKCLKKGLNDANPGVREKTRGTYWLFASIWASRAEAIMDSLDSTAQKLLNKDPANPNGSSSSSFAKPGMGLSKSTGARPSLRETLLAQKKAAMAAKKEAQSRPGSAMSSHVVSSRSTSSVLNSSSNATLSASAPAPASGPMSRSRGGEGTTAVGSGSMSVAPVRPRRKPAADPIARPATAGPYSVRSHEAQPEELVTPEPRYKSSIMSSKGPQVHQQPSPKKTIPRPRSVQGHHISEPVHSPARSFQGSESPTRIPRSPVRNAYRSPTRAISRPTTPHYSPSKTRSAISQPITLAITPPRFQTSVTAPASTSPRLDPAPKKIKVSPPPGGDDVFGSITRDRDEAAINSVRTKLFNNAVPAAREVTPSAEPVLQDVTNMAKTYDDSIEQYKQMSVRSPVSAERHFSPDLSSAPVDHAAAPGGGSTDKARVNDRLLDSGINRVKTKTLDVHGFRKLQSLLREKTSFSNEKFDALLIGLFQYLEDPLPALAADKAQDVKAQVLASIKLLLKNHRANFRPHVAHGLEIIMATRSTYDARTHIVSGLEVLADELVSLGSAPELIVTITHALHGRDDASADGSRCLGTGLHILSEILERHPAYVPSDSELAGLARLADQCLESNDSAVRMGAVQLCVAIHGRVGEAAFWEALKDIKADPKSLITYYIVKRQRESA
ncbi:hypothetical protein TD95_005180 [Thielaviopsis punctulata]|uniref:TOG domain-containing protein n=1 Tax=Thielaviopsis punctulata TaxID=72032 RepID=A0A0F4ZEV3_9PEZI|nr:hypothetical protein TD95_005180 [Thielaviopsis punctulata]